MSLPQTYSAIISAFGGTSLLAAGANAGNTAPVSFSDFGNEGSGSFTAGFGFGFGTGYQVTGTVFGTGNCIFPNGQVCAALYQGLSTSSTTIVVKAIASTNTDAVFKTIYVAGLTLTRTAAVFSASSGGTWTFSGIPAGTIVDGVTYTPIFRTT